jgi:molybdopterin synthase sulfur carrier subunit
VKIVFYGQLAEAIAREVEIDAVSGGSVGDVRRKLAEIYPAAASMLRRPSVRACLDDRVVDDSAVVAGGAELAFLPPLSGG